MFAFLKILYLVSVKFYGPQGINLVHFVNEIVQQIKYQKKGVCTILKGLIWLMCLLKLGEKMKTRSLHHVNTANK